MANAYKNTANEGSEFLPAREGIVANDQGHLKVAEAGTDWPGKEDAEEETPQDGE